MGLAVDGDLALLHGLEQGGLRLGRGAIDFIREEECGEDRALDEGELVALEVEDVCAGDVRGHQVGRELDAVVLAPEDARERADEERLGHARHALHQRVLICEDGDEGVIDDLLLADDDLLISSRARRRVSFISLVSIYFFSARIWLIIR